MKTLNARGRPFSWSISALQAFELCPKKYAAARFYYSTPYVESEAARWGNRVHKAAEDFINILTRKTPAKRLDDQALAPVQLWCEALFKAGLKPTAELEVCLNEQMQSTGWWDEDAWLRIKIDVVVPVGEKLMVYDWKTGRPKDDPDQLKLYIAALFTAKHFARRYDGRLVWLKDGTTSGMGGPIEAIEIPNIWDGFLARVRRMELAWGAENFPARQNFLCKNWCDVKDCPHCGRRG